MDEGKVLYWSCSLVKRSSLFNPNFQYGQANPGSSIIQCLVEEEGGFVSASR